MDGSYVLPKSGPKRVDTSLAVQATPDSASRCSTPPATSPVKPVERTQRQRIVDAVRDRDVKQLTVMAAESGGFEDSELRRSVWPILLGCDEKGKGKADPIQVESLGKSDSAGSIDANAQQELEPHQDERQVHLDVLRSFVSFPTDITSVQKDALRVRLEKIIVTTLRRHRSLQYFQGYHDIITVLLLTFDDDELCQAAADRMSLHRLRDSMGSGLEPVMGYLRLLHRILCRVDPELAKVVEAAAELPYFSLSWVLTLMSHDLTSISVIARLFDFLLAHNPAMVSYLGVTIILLKKEELAQLDEESAEDPAVLHHTLSQLPQFVEAKPAPANVTGVKPAPSETAAVGAETTDEDLMSSQGHSPSTSFMTDSVLSVSSMASSTSTLDLSLDALDDSMLADPDIFGPAFSTPYASQNQTPPASPSPSSPAATRRQQSPTITIDAVIARTLEIYKAHPLVSPDVGNAALAADEVMGPKSCVFTWPLSQEGRLSDAEADEIARLGVDIVVPPKSEEEAKLEETVNELDATRKRRQTKDSIRRRRREIGMGAALTLVGVAGVLLAMYGSDLRDVKWQWPSLDRWHLFK